MSKLKGLTVTLKKGKHKTQPWTYTIDEVGPGPNSKATARFASKYSAWRSALRKLNAVTGGGTFEGRAWNYSGGYSWYHKDAKGKLRPITFVEA